MDDQLDGKTLVGTYVCTDQPGEFKWQPGSLTQVCCIEFRWHPRGIYPATSTLIFFFILAGYYEWFLGGS